MSKHKIDRDKEFDAMLNEYLDSEVEKYKLEKQHSHKCANIIDYAESADKYRLRQL